MFDNSPEISNIYDISVRPGKQDAYRPYQLKCLQRLSEEVPTSLFSMPEENALEWLKQAPEAINRIFAGHEAIIDEAYGVSALIGNLSLIKECEIKLVFLKDLPEEERKGLATTIFYTCQLIDSWRSPKPGLKLNEVAVFFEAVTLLYFSSIDAICDTLTDELNFNEAGESSFDDEYLFTGYEPPKLLAQLPPEAMLDELMSPKWLKKFAGIRLKHLDVPEEPENFDDLHGFGGYGDDEDFE